MQPKNDTQSVEFWPEIGARLWRIYLKTRWRWLGDLVALMTPIDRASEVMPLAKPQFTVTLIQADPVPPPSVQRALIEDAIDRAVEEYPKEEGGDWVSEAKVMPTQSRSGLQGFEVRIKPQ